MYCSNFGAVDKTPAAGNLYTQACGSKKFTGFRAYFIKVYIVYGGFNGVKHAHMYACIFRIYVCDFYRIYDDNTGNARCYNNKCV